MQDSSKVLQEKFALTRELDRIRPEMEHLQSQLASNQAAVAEKNRLQRELDSLEVELENEKRLRQRTQDKENKAISEELKARAEDAEKQVAAEKREREKMQKQHDKALAEANTRSERMEEKLSTMKDKVKSLQSELKEAKAEAQRQRSEADSARQAEAKAKATTTATATANGARPGRKRRVEESSFGDITVDTPGNEHQPERRPLKKRGLEHAPMGEKSTFSVTPFLNRNKSMTDASQVDLSPVTQPQSDAEPAQEQPAEAVAPVEADEAQATDAAEEPEPEPAPAKTKSKANATGPPKVQKARGRPKAKPLGEISPAKNNAGKRAVEVASESTQEQGTEAADQENEVKSQSKQPAVAKPKAKTLKQDAPDLAPSLATRAPAVDAGAKKKRKLLGANSTIFDDDDGEGEAAAVSATIKPSQAGKRKRAPLGAFGAGAFGGASFSPLKKDRRGVGASFLG